MAANIRVGVVIAAYDMAAWIGTCLASLLDQTHRDWTAVVVDDGSRDGTATVVAGFTDPRIRLVRQLNTGVSAARNLGLTAIEGDAVLFLDADDWLAPDALARMVSALAANPTAAAVFGPFALMFATAVPGDRPTRVKCPRLAAKDGLRTLLVGNCFANGGHLLIRRCAVARAGRFNTRLTFAEDWEYWTRLALVGPFLPVPGCAPLLFVREREGGAYRSRVTDLAVYAPAALTIFSNPEIRARYPGRRLEALRRAGHAEKAWIAGRAMLDRGSRHDGLGLLRWSVREHPTPRRLSLLLALRLREAVGSGVAGHAFGGASSVISRTPMPNVK